MSTEQSSKKRKVEFAAAEEEESSADDSSLDTPERALKGRYAESLKALFNSVLDVIDQSSLPFFKSQVRQKKIALTDFIWWLFDAHGKDATSIDDSDAETDEASSDFADDSSCSDDDGGTDSDDDNSASDDADDDEDFVPKKKSKKQAKSAESDAVKKE